MDHVDDPLMQQPKDAPAQPETSALSATRPAGAVEAASEVPMLPVGWQNPWGTGSTAKSSPSGARPLSGVTLTDVLVSPLQELLSVLDNALAKPERPQSGQTMIEWVQLGLPAFPLPEDIRGSFMDHVI